MSARLTATSWLLRLVAKPRLARMSFERMRADNLADPPPGVAATHAVEVAELGGTRCVWLDRDRRDAGVIVYLHGGSYVCGPYAGHWAYLSRLLGAAGGAGLLVDYGLAPEHRCPAARDDVAAALAAAESAGDLAPGRWALVGDSAGGALALVAAYMRRDAGATLPACLVLSSPGLDLTLSNPEARSAERRDPMLTISMLLRCNAAYIGDHDWKDPLVSPYFGDPSGLPPTFVHSGSRELLGPDARRWAERARRSGSDVIHVEQSGGFHGFALAPPSIREAREALAREAEFVSGSLA